MKLIYYDEAASTLGIDSSTLRHAVTDARKILTIVRNGKKNQLIEEQVLLFRGKRLSFSALTSAEREKWREYAAQPQEQTRQEFERQLAAMKEAIAGDIAKKIVEAFGGTLHPKPQAIA